MRSGRQRGMAWLRYVPPAFWLAEYRAAWLGDDLVAGVTLAAYAIPVSLAYAGLAGLPPQAGIYGYLLGGLGYALLGSSRQLAIGPTSAISLMIAASVGAMAEGDAARYAQIASLAGFTVALLCLISWLFRLSMLVRLISDSILVGFKAGAGLTIMMTQLPSVFAVNSGGNNFFERAVLFTSQLGQIHYLVLALGIMAILLLLAGERFLPGKPVGLAVVALSILAALAFGLADLGVLTTGEVPAGLPFLEGPKLRLRDVEGIFPLAIGCLLLAYIESVSAARTFAAKHGYTLDPRQEFLGIGAANFAAALGHGYPVAGGLSQSAVNNMAGALQGILLAGLASILMLLARASQPHVAFLGRVPGTNSYSDLARHPENEAPNNAIAFRPEASLLYVNADSVLETVLERLQRSSDIRLVVCDLSASSYVDLAGARMLHRLHDALASRGIALRIIGARGRVRDLLRADGIAEKIKGVERVVTLDSLLSSVSK
jgi:sulfate permease, SulP family